MVCICIYIKACFKSIFPLTGNFVNLLIPLVDFAPLPPNVISQVTPTNGGTPDNMQAGSVLEYVVNLVTYQVHDGY